MTYTVESIEDIGQEAWDKFISTSPYSCTYHKFGMLNTTNLLPGVKNISFGILDKTGIRCAVPLIIDTSKYSLIQKILPVKLGSLHSNGIVVSGNADTPLYNTIISELKERGKKYRACELTYNSPPLRVISKLRDPLLNTFDKCGGDLRILDLRQDTDALWNQMEKRGRNGARYALKNHIEVHSIRLDTSGIDMVYNLYTRAIRNTRDRAFTRMWFNSILQESKDAIALVACRYDKPVAISVTNHDGCIADHWLCYSDKEGLKYRANTLLQWDLITRLKNIGIGYYIIGEVLPHAGIDGRMKFERTFGGEIYYAMRYRLALDSDWMLLKDLLLTFHNRRLRK